MPNHYFDFKQFRVNQEHCAMKVCTDACLFGAWAAKTVNDCEIAPKSILDIGAGTGLLSLMLAQTCSAQIDAVEIEAAAATEAAANCKASPWKDQINVIHHQVQALANNQKLYDLIISNPPFYEQDLKSPDTNKNLALHSQALTLKELLVSANQLLAEKGYFAVLLPFERKAIFVALAEKEGLYVQKSTDVQQTEKHAYFRTMLLLSRTETAVKTDKMIIKINNAYSAEFRALLTPFYLPF